MNIFHGRSLRDDLDGRERAMQEDIRTENEERILGADMQQLVDYFVARHEVERLAIDFAAVYVTEGEAMVRAEDFPNGFFTVREGKSYPKPQYTYHVPLSGNTELLKCQPSAYMMWTHEIAVRPDEFTFEIIAFYDEPSRIKSEADEVLSNSKRLWQSVDSEVASFNERLHQTAARMLADRKEALLKRRALTASLGVPVRRTDSARVPPAFTVPVKKKPLITKPSAPSGGFTPEPALADEIYCDILGLIRDYGVMMERHPSLHEGKDEEALRDQLLLVLTPHFESATGETFNKSGKTDILIRHEMQNVFVSECKIWQGRKALLEAVDQILGYLTWRDSKASLILFVRNKSISDVLDQIPTALAEHSCHVRFGGRVSEGWFSFTFHLPGDPSRMLSLAVQCFHFPTDDEPASPTEAVSTKKPRRAPRRR